MFRDEVCTRVNTINTIDRQRTSETPILEVRSHFRWYGYTKFRVLDTYFVFKICLYNRVVLKFKELIKMVYICIYLNKRLFHTNLSFQPNRYIF